ncbi:hypothetical protein CTEN210_17993 [Chaetoceros tenuissimus]|uniref:Right handed beta helix domain-containing protein n=1 Tax=Chaetoceros tenuissimus TaxID=426638 RepID=A0AAD3HF16_9STRA|nr:hypothetical protein CTEN210_17993 [Chaetoceros tenuissimus]
MNMKKLHYLVLVLALLPIIGIASNVPTGDASSTTSVLSATNSSSENSNSCNVTISGLSLADAITDNTCNEIYIENGTYLIENTIDIKRPIHISGESKENTILQKIGGGSLLLVIRTQDVIVEKLTLDAYTNDSDDDPIYEAFGVFGSNNCTLLDCLIYGSNHMFAVFFAGPYVDAGKPTIDAFEAGDLDSGNVMEGNYVREYSKLDIVSFSLQKNGVVRNNVVEGGVISFFMTRDSECIGNRIENSMTQGIFVSVPADQNLILNNTVINSAAARIKVAIQVDHVVDPDADHKVSLTPTSYRAKGIVINKNRIQSSNFFGIEMTNTVKAKVESNSILNSALSGIYLLRVDETTLSKNSILHFGKECFDENFSKFNAGIWGDYKTKSSDISFNKIIASNKVCAVNAIRINNDGTQVNNKVKCNKILGKYEGDEIDVTESSGNKMEECDDRHGKTRGKHLRGTP